MLVVLALGLISAASAIDLDGRCPEVTVVQHLTALAMRTWYQVGRYPNDIEKRGDCVHFTFKKETNRFKVTITEIVDGVLEEFSGFVDYDLKYGDDSGDLVLSSSSFKETTDNSILMPLYVLAVDYDSHLIMYSCKQTSDTTRHDYLWISSITNRLSPSARVIIDKYIETSDIIDKTKLIWDHFNLEYCKVKA